MAEYVEVDVRGLSCPEPVLLAMDAMQDHPGKLIRVLGDEAHTRKNIEKMLEYENKSGQMTVRPDGCFEITFQARSGREKRTGCSRSIPRMRRWRWRRSAGTAASPAG